MSKTAIGKLFDKIGAIFERIFGAAENTYGELTPVIQEALRRGSEIVQIINDNLSQAPDFIFDIIRERFPDVTEEKLSEILAKVAGAFNVADNIHDADIKVTLQNIQTALIESRAKDGTVWAAISSTAAKLIAVFLAPKGTKWATVETLMEYVYRTFIKK